MSTSNSIEIAHSDQELVGSAKKRRQFMILGGLCVLAVVVITAIVLSVVLINDGGTYVPEDTREALELNDIIRGRLQPKRFNGTWVDDNSYHFFDTNGNLVLYDVKLRKETIIALANEKLVQGSSFEFSADKKYILIASQLIKLFRHSFFALWDVYDIEQKQLIPVTIRGQSLAYRLVKFSPVDSSLIVVYENNIYYKKSPTDAEIQITTDGTKDISNGVPDWVFEEEVFSSNSASWFSPDGKKLTYIRFDDTNVPVMSLPVYGGAGDPQFQYPQTLDVHYPKVGVENPIVRLFYVDLSLITDTASVVRHEIPTPAHLVTPQKDHLITSISWANNNDMIAVWMNRVQNKGEIQKCSTTNTEPSCVEAKNLDAANGWIDFFTAPFYNKDGSSMVYIASSNGYRHLVDLNLNTFVLTPRTSGNFVVTEVLSYNKDQNIVLFTANTEEDCKAQHIYAIKNEANAVKTCLTCGPLSVTNGIYSYFSAEVSKDGNNIVVTSLGPEMPRVDLYAFNVQGTNFSLTDHLAIEINAALRRTLENKKLPKVIYDKIELDNGSESQVMMVVPSDFSESKTYPMLVEVYGGPDSSSVTNKWSVEWGSYLVSSREIIYAKIDGRGSGLRGDKNLFALYRKLGTVEVEDQIETTSKLQKKHKYLDASKAAIWGWSYGGYVSGMSLTNDNVTAFKCAVSVAPVTDWTLYDSIYTERYMGLPLQNDNKAAYDKARLMQYVDHIPSNNKTYMLVHGTLDDNVHFQQGMLLARVLERRDIQFKEITYPDEDHSLAGVRPHLYHSLGKFFDECFDYQKPT